MRSFRSKKKAFFLLTLFLAVFFSFVAANTHIPRGPEGKARQDAVRRSEDLPYQETVLSMIRPLEYSALPVMLDPEVSLEVDFSKRVWILRNFREYDEAGQLVLKEGRYGLCAGLAAHVHQELKPLLGERYSIEFARATEPDFFDTLASNHILLVISDRLNGEIFMLDPSFHRYGRPETFSGYVLHAGKDVLGSIQRSDRDAVFNIGDTMPLVIRNGSLVVFSVESVKGTLDPQNIVLAIGARRRQSSSGRYLFALRKQGGKIETLQEEPMLEQLLSREERVRLAQKLLSWMQAL